MTGDSIGATLALVAAVYAVGVANRGWTSPLDIWHAATGHRWCGHDECWSDPVDGPDVQNQPADVQTSTPGPLRPPETLVHPMTGPGPLPGQPVTDRIPHETRIAWVRRQLEAGVLGPGDIDALGAEQFAVSERQVRRWRAALGDDRKGSPA